MFKYLIVFTAALIPAVFFTQLIAKVFLKYKILKVNNIPLAGGLGIGLASIFSLSLAVFMFNPGRIEILAVAGVSLLMLWCGIVDDLKGLSVIQKLLIQSGCAILLIGAGIRTNIMYFGFLGNALITYFWILGIINAFNLLDIMDGLAAGVALIVGCAFLIMGFLSANLTVQIFSLILCAGSIGFLIFNLPAAKVYLGNSGSYFLGMLIISIALITHYASENNAFALVSPLLILGLPILDTLFLIIFRLMRKKSPFKKSNDHLALKIRALGYSPVKSILMMYILAIIFSGCGVILTQVNLRFATGIIISLFVLSVIIFLKLAKVESK